MKLPLTVAALLAAVALAAFLWLESKEETANAGVSSGLVVSGTALDREVPLLAEVGQDATTRAPEAELHADPGIARYSRPPVAPVLTPLHLEIINQTTKEPVPFVFVRITDHEGHPAKGWTDRWGRLRVSTDLLSGPLAITVQVSVPNFADGRIRRGQKRKVLGEMWLAPQESPGASSTVTQCIVDVSRIVPLKFSIMGPDGPQSIDGTGLKLYGTDARGTTSFEMLPMDLTLPDDAPKVDLLGTTHLLCLEAAPSTNDAQIAWDPIYASKRRAERELRAFAVTDTGLFGVRLPAVSLPRLGDPPIQLVLTPIDLEDVKLPAVYEYLASAHAEIAKKARIKVELKNRETHGLMVLVETASGNYTGSVSVRANPTAKARVAHAEASASKLRKEWVDAIWTLDDSSRVHAALVNFYALDAAEYTIQVVCLDGEPSTVESVTVMVPPTSRRVVCILIPDR